MPLMKRDEIRRGIDRVIRERMENGKPDRATLRAGVEEFRRRYIGTGPFLSEEEIEELVSTAMDER